MFRFAVSFFLIFGAVQPASVVPAAVNDISAPFQDNRAFIVTMKDGITSALQNLTNLTSRRFASRDERLNAVTESLKQHARSSQARILQFLRLAADPASYESIWITNQIVIRNASWEVIMKLEELFPEISNIREEAMALIDKPIEVKHEAVSNLNQVQWGVEQIEAPSVWAAGNNGTSIVIATIDTGVRYTHEALVSNFRSDYGWYDPSQKTTLPNDQNGHGTHTTANIAGTLNGVGVAPGSKWITCKGCATSACSQSNLLACGQFILCPTDPQGKNPDCTKAPHIVSNSWGWGSGGVTFFDDVIRAWRAAGIIPLFSVGNAGPFCGTAHSPADNENVIGVGATMEYNEITVFSSTGPTVGTGRIKPDVAAPGYEIVSAAHTADNAYVRMSGSSMACPHAAGTVALILSSNPSLSYDEVKVILEGGCAPTQSTGRHCGGIPEDVYPNHHVGFGRINAWSSYLKAKKYMLNGGN